MNRREFLKGALTVAALAPITRIAAKAGLDGDKSSDSAKGAQVTRRRYKNTAQTVPLLGFGMMRLPRLSPDKPLGGYETFPCLRVPQAEAERGENPSSRILFP